MAQEPTVGELRVMLADERRSSQQHRIDLDKLKAAHVSLEEEKLKLKGQLADSEQRHKAELLQLKLDTVKQKAELENTHRKAMVELTNAKLDAELALKAANEHKRTAAEKEKETERRHQLTRTKDWDRARQLESEKVLLEAQLSEVATAKAAADQRLMEAEKQMKRLKQAQESQRQELEEEMLALRTRLKASLAVREDTNKVTAENHVLRQKLELLEEERRKDRAAIEGTMQQKDGLSETVERLKSELQRKKEKL
ncbi:NBP2B protein, putative [Ixodes scapularis]|uniref:NBP2B protein, putative n=1 Tax=Ixodes scapularis TaxID=6945 RepID=B7P7Z9_IXOSC|nr:NBP2B protein, putative [Ixodes scapularis]|eukprot:XP_002400455.1 NBP2B protein, putative [Ixodes scapularis]